MHEERRIIEERAGTRRPRRRVLSLTQRRGLVGWAFLSIAAFLIIWMNFYPMVRGFMIALHRGPAANMEFTGFSNFARMLEDTQFHATIRTTFLYLLVQVPIMLVLALVLATMLNNKKLKGRGIFRTMIFLPCTVGLVAYAMVFRQMFAFDGLANTVLTNLGILSEPFNWFGEMWSSRLVVVLGLLWRWTGFNMIFYLAGLQNIDSSIYEAARIDGAGPVRQLFSITIPLLRPIILLTAIMSTNGTLQLFDESMNLAPGLFGNASLRTMSHHIFSTAYQGRANVGYASAMAFVVFLMVAALALIQMKVGDKR